MDAKSEGTHPLLTGAASKEQLQPLRSPVLNQYCGALVAQRDEIFAFLSYLNQVTLWKPLSPSGWSPGEHLVHLCKTMEIVRACCRFWIPLAKPFARLFTAKPFERTSSDIYDEYELRHGRPMRAPWFILPDRIPELSLADLRGRLDDSLLQLRFVIAGVTDEIGGHIRFPDPLAHHPNLLQGVHILVIHENHHFQSIRRCLTCDNNECFSEAGCATVRLVRSETTASVAKQRVESKVTA